MRFTFFDSDHYVLEPGGEAADLKASLGLALPWDRCCADDGGNPVCVLQAPQQAGARCAVMCTAPCPACGHSSTYLSCRCR